MNSMFSRFGFRVLARPAALCSLWLLCCAAQISLAKEAEPLASNVQVEERLVHIAEELRCLVCQNESLASSHADLAEDLRAQVREQIASGKSDQQIKDYLVERYGDFVLYRPVVKPLTWLLWFGPFVALLLALIALARAIQKRNRQIASAGASSRAPDSPSEQESGTDHSFTPIHKD
jgi:cytochrome c-type biogenesis protein CcmH